MTVRTKAVGDITVYAGTAAELAAVAEDYVSGARRLPRDHHPELFQRAAALLRTGRHPSINLGAVRFYRDRPSGEPYRGPYAPRPGDAWVRQQRSLGSLMRA